MDQSTQLPRVESATITIALADGSIYNIQLPPASSLEFGTVYEDDDYYRYCHGGISRAPRIEELYFKFIQPTPSPETHHLYTVQVIKEPDHARTH
jgi:hypothetical protein